MFLLILFEKHSTSVDTHTRMSTYPYEYTHAHPTLMSTSEKLSRFDLKIHEVGHQDRITVDETSALTERIISRKYNTHVKSKI
jgi:hypothetical protein